MNPRTPVFDAIRQVRGRGFTNDEVEDIDALLGKLGIPSDTTDGRRHINDEGLALIKSFEGVRLSTYLDAVGVPTIGYGHTGPEVRQGQRITPSEAETLLLRDLRRFEECVERACPGLSDNRFSACVSLAFNIGCAAFERSTVARMAKAGNHLRAQAAFGLWIKAGGRVLTGLVRRRAAEAKLYGKG